jgi:hypothetical protein
MAAATPYIARRPQVTLDGTVTLDCHAREARLTPEDSEVDTGVFCAQSRRQPGMTKWTLELVVIQSFGNGLTTEGLYDQLAPLSKTSVTYLLETDKLVGPSEDAPHFTGTLWVPSIPIISAAMSDKSEFTLTFAVNEDPTKVVV